MFRNWNPARMGARAVATWAWLMWCTIMAVGGNPTGPAPLTLKGAETGYISSSGPLSRYFSMDASVDRTDPRYVSCLTSTTRSFRQATKPTKKKVTITVGATPAAIMKASSLRWLSM